jgi:hypothetical protein
MCDAAMGRGSSMRLNPCGGDEWQGPYPACAVMSLNQTSSFSLSPSLVRCFGFEAGERSIRPAVLGVTSSKGLHAASSTPHTWAFTRICRDAGVGTDDRAHASPCTTPAENDGAESHRPTPSFAYQHTHACWLAQLPFKKKWCAGKATAPPNALRWPAA